MLELFARAKGTSPPDINARIKNNPMVWDLVRDLLDTASSEQQIIQIKQQLAAFKNVEGVSNE